MKTNQTGLDLIKQFEVLKLKPYKDQGGKWTIGYGHLIKEGEQYLFAGITELIADTLLVNDVKTAENAINTRITKPLSSNQFSALVAFVFNTGEGNFADSTLLKELTAGNLPKIPGEIMRWHFVEKKPSKGLIRRRAAEAILFLT